MYLMKQMSRASPTPLYTMVKKKKGAAIVIFAVSPLEHLDTALFASLSTGSTLRSSTSLNTMALINRERKLRTTLATWIAPK